MQPELGKDSPTTGPPETIGPEVVPEPEGAVKTGAEDVPEPDGDANDGEVVVPDPCPSTDAALLSTDPASGEGRI